MNSDFRIAVGFLRHPKVKRLKRALGDSAVLSHIQLLEFTALQRPEGVLTGMDAEAVADASDWDGNADAYVETLLKIGLLDADTDGVLMVHDWLDHNPWAAGATQRSEKAKNAANARWHTPSDALAQVKQENSDTPSTPTAMPNDATSINEQCGEQTSGNAPLLSFPLLSESSPNPTEKTPPECPKKDTLAPQGAAARASSGLDSDFETFWQAYPLHEAKEPARKAFAKLRPPPELFQRLLAAIAEQKQGEQWRRGIVPHAATWLNQRRWTDEPPPAASTVRGSPAKPAPPSATVVAGRFGKQLRNLGTPQNNQEQAE